MSNDMLPTLFDSETVVQPQEQALFDYEQVPPDRRGFVFQKTAETQWLLKRTTEDILKIGKNMSDIKASLPHGMFTRLVESEFGMSVRNAQHFMNIAQKLGDKSERRSLLGMGLGVEVLRELASASDEIIDQAVAGELPLTKEDIKQAKLEARMAKLEAARSKAEAQAAQLQLFNNQDAAQKEIEALTKQINDLKQELETAVTPEVEIVEVTKEVLPESAKNTLEELQAKIDKLNADLESEKSAIPPDVQKKLDNLQKQADKLKQQEEVNKSQQERIDRLNDELRAAVRDSIASENDERIRQDWRTINSEVRSCLMRLLGQWPTPLDVRSFESDDYERLSQLKSTLRRVLEECDALSYGSDHVEESPIAFIEAGR